MAAEMIAITAPSWVEPSGYELSKIQRPTISKAKDVLIKVHAASINPIDVKKANGAMKMIFKDKFPYRIGYDAAGVVEKIGTEVTQFKTGDAVFVRLPEYARGSWGEYVVCEEPYIAHKPTNISFAEAASIPLAALTALQAFQNYKGSLEGKTVLVPAGLGGTGAYACQLAKNVFKAGTVITTVSTSKVSMVPELLGEGTVDEIIDYTKQDPRTVIPGKSVDFLFDTTGQTTEFLPLMTPKTSLIVSISTMPSGTTMQNSQSMQLHPDKPTVPFAIKLFLNGADALLRFKAKRYDTDYKYIFMDPNGKDLTDIKGWVEEGKIKPVVGLRADLHDLETVKEAAGATYAGKGIIGKTVFEVIPDQAQ